MPKYDDKQNQATLHNNSMMNTVFMQQYLHDPFLHNFLPKERVGEWNYGYGTRLINAKWTEITILISGMEWNTLICGRKLSILLDILIVFFNLCTENHHMEFNTTIFTLLTSKFVKVRSTTQHVTFVSKWGRKRNERYCSFEIVNWRRLSLYFRM